MKLKKTQTLLGTITFFLFVINSWLVFIKLPLDQNMGVVQKIMYIHVPSIWLTFLAFFVVFILSIAFLWKKNLLFDEVAASSAEIGVLFCAISIMTGAIWGKPTWNTYWTWDARLTTTFILFLIYVAYLLVRRFMKYGEERAKVSSILGIVGFLDVPLIHKSVEWWRTLHQPSTMFSTKKNVISSDLKNVLIFSVVCFTALYFYLLIKRYYLGRARNELNELIYN